MKVEINRVNQAFLMEGIGDAQVKVSIDAGIQIGGDDAGLRPMELVLVAAGSCSAIDLIAILKKQRQNLKSLKIVVDGERAKNVVPAVFASIHISYYLEGEIEANKAVRALDLALNKYCSVTTMLKEVAITSSLFLNGEEL